MKKYTILLATIILAFAACNKETPAPEMPDAPDAPHGAVPFTFHATVGELTKTEISENADGSAAVLWKATDKVSVFDAAGNNCEFSVSGAGSTATLSGELVPSSSGRYYAVYPYAPSSTLSGTTVTAEIPSVQKVSGPGFADGAVVSAAEVSEEAATFCNLASLVRFTVPEDVTTLRSVTLASTAPLSGALVMDFAGGSPAVTSVPDHATTVTVEMEDGSALPSGNYYVAVLPGSHKLTVTLTDLDGMTAERAMDEAREFASSHIRGIGSVKADTFDNVEFVLGDAAFTGETKTLIMSAKVPAGTYTMEQLLGVTSYQYKGDKAIYVIDNLSFTVGSTTEKQTISVAKSDLTARHLLVREGDDLQAVLDAAEAGLDDVYVGAGTFTGGFTMAEDINVTGSWNDDFSETITYEPLKSTSGITTILDGGGSQRVVNQAAAFTESTVTTWKNLKIQNGSANTGAGAYLQAYGILDGCEITGNTTTGDGAGVVALNWATTTRCYIHHNTATGQGGGIVTRYVLSYSVVDSNQAKGSGGAYVYAGGYSGESVERPRIFNCIISNNKATNDNCGGVRANRGNSNPLPVLYNLLVVGNTATGWAGSGILVNAGCVYNCTVVKNYTSATQDNANALYNATNYSTDKEKGRIQACIAFGNWTEGKDADAATQIYMNSTGGLRNNSTSANGQWKAKAAYDYVTRKDVTEAFFTNYTNGDYTLSGNNTDCISNGTLNGLGGLWSYLPKTDLAGNNRLYNNNTQIGRGCYQYQN